MKKSTNGGVIREDEAYAKQELMLRLGISQKFWDKMLNEGLPVTHVGHAKWVTGRAVLRYLENHSERKGGNHASE